MKSYYLIYLCLIALVATSGIPVADEIREVTQSSLITVSGNSLFINVPESEKNSPYISGEIYCEQDTQYTFTFGFDGSGSYDVVIGNTVLTPSNGASLRTFTVVLKAGYTPCSVSVSASTTGFAYGRLTITHINDSTSYPDAEGYIDLVACD